MFFPALITWLLSIFFSICLISCTKIHRLTAKGRGKDGESVKRDVHTVLLMQMGQFIDHDLAHTPV